MSVTFHGLDEFLAGLDRFADEVTDLSTKGSAGDLIAETAAQSAPRLTGELAGSIQTKTDGDTVHVFATAPHAAPIIVGVPSRNIEPHPIFDGAVQAREADVIAQLERDVQAAADRI